MDVRRKTLAGNGRDAGVADRACDSALYVVLLGTGNVGGNDAFPAADVCLLCRGRRLAVVARDGESSPRVESFNCPGVAGSASGLGHSAEPEQYRISPLPETGFGKSD